MRRSTKLRYKNSWIDLQGDSRFPHERVKGKDKKYLRKWSKKRIVKLLEEE